MKKTALIAALGVLAAGCATSDQLSRVAVLQNPETKQTVECRVDQWGSFDRKKQVDICITTYQKAGYKLVADSLNP